MWIKAGIGHGMIRCAGRRSDEEDAMINRYGGAAVFSLVALALSAAYANGDHQGGLEHPHMWDYGWGMMIFGPLMIIAFVATVVVGVVLLVRRFGPSAAPHGPAARTSLDILEERFARGEIDAEEFEARRRVLSSN